MEFDQEGNLIGHSGGPGAGYDWPESVHGITVDCKGNVWLGGNGRGAINGQDEESKAGDKIDSFRDNQLLKFTQDPEQKFLYVADSENDRVHSIATNSKGNIYTTETHRGQRVPNLYLQLAGAVAVAVLLERQACPASSAEDSTSACAAAYCRCRPPFNWPDAPPASTTGSGS